MWTKILPRHLAVCALVVLFACAAESQTAQTPQKLSIPSDSPRWELQGQAKPVEYQGRKSLYLDGGAAILKDFEMRDGIIDVDVATPATRGFFGMQFRLDKDGANGEWVYLRQHKSGNPDAMQYTPVLNTGANWQIYNGPGFTGAVDIPKDVWFHLRLEVSGAQAKLFVKDMDKPALVMNDLKSGIQKGQVALHVLIGADLFLEFRNTNNTRCSLGAASAIDAGRHSDQVEPVTFVRRARTQSRVTAFVIGKRRHPLARCGGRAAGICGHLSLSRGAPSASHVCERLFQAPRTATRNEGRVCAYQPSTQIANNLKDFISATATRLACF